MTIKKSFFPLLMLLFFLFSGCEKEDDKTLLFPGKSKIDFGYNDNMLELSLGNIADQTLNWSATVEDDFLVLDQTSGTLEAGAYLSLSISLQRDKIAGDSVKSSITFSSNVGQDIRVGVLIHNYPEDKIRLSRNVNDMAFDKNKQLLYFLSGNSDYLEVFDINEKTFRKIDIDLEFYSGGSFLQLMPDGKNLIISVYQSLYLLDIETEKIVYSHDFNNEIISAVGTPEQKIYITIQNLGQSFYTLNINTQELLVQSIEYNFLYLQAHPSWKYIYGIGYNDELTKIDIQGEIPQEVYTGYNYGTANRLWISCDGTRIITSNKRFITIDPDLAGYDVIETESISVSSFNYIRDFAENQQNNEYYLIFRDSYYYDEDTELYACDQNMNTLRKIVPEPFIAVANSGGYESVEAMPLFVFSNPADNSLILLTYASVDYREVYALEILDNKKL